MFRRLEIFKDEIELIQNPEIKQFVQEEIMVLPDYFFEVPASSTGKYHPKYAIGKGGLVRHTKAAVGIAKDLLKLKHNQELFSSDTRDCIIAALLLHDGWKHGAESKYTIANHPVVAADHILNDNPNFAFRKEIADLIRSHMGEWNTDYKTKEVIMPVPKTPEEIFVHECDYLASRKYLLYDFESYYVPEQYALHENPLKDKISELILLCKSEIENGTNREELYEIISENNDGMRNPNSIPDIETAEKIINIIKGKGRD